MSSKLKIIQLRLKNYRQFKNVCFDFVDNETNEPLDKVCFVGANGTGKSTVLAILGKFLHNQFGKTAIPKNSILSIKFRDDSQNEFYFFHATFESSMFKGYLDSKVGEHALWNNLWHSSEQDTSSQYEYSQMICKQFSISNLNLFPFKSNSKDIAIYASSDGSSLLPNNLKLPDTSLNNALRLTKSMPAYHEFSHTDVADFWNVLIYQIKQRERHYLDFLNAEEIRQISVGEAEARFNSEFPEILLELADLWNIILEPTGLKFDVKGAKVPVQLNENLKAYICLKDSDEIIPYNQLSTGIRNFIFRLGHIFSLYFNREIERGFLLVDEPELSLFPDLLFDIVAWYESIIHNTQFFVATHSPMVAAQFKASERFILEFDEHGYVQVRQGISPEGDDPNDLLMSDFSVRSLYGKVGQEKWQRVLELRKEIKKTEDTDLKTELLDEYMDIVNAYNFAPHELS